MNFDQCRKFSIELFLSITQKINLYDFDDYIKTPADVIDISAFLESYSNKYYKNFFEVDVNNATFHKKERVLSDIIKNIRELGSGNFEKLSALICKCFGYTKNYVATKKTHDEGIDFLASTDFEEINIDYEKHAIGQCKHYGETLVDVKDIRELAGAVLLFSRKEFSTNVNSYSRFHLGAFSNTNVFFLSNYFFSESAIELCNKTKIIPLDILDITLICAKGIRTDVLKWINSEGVFDNKKFMREINEISIVQ